MADYEVIVSLDNDKDVLDTMLSECCSQLGLLYESDKIIWMEYISLSFQSMFPWIPDTYWEVNGEYGTLESAY